MVAHDPDASQCLNIARVTAAAGYKAASHRFLFIIPSTMTICILSLLALILTRCLSLRFLCGRILHFNARGLSTLSLIPHKMLVKSHFHCRVLFTAGSPTLRRGECAVGRRAVAHHRSSGLTAPTAAHDGADFVFTPLTPFDRHQIHSSLHRLIRPHPTPIPPHRIQQPPLTSLHAFSIFLYARSSMAHAYKGGFLTYSSASDFSTPLYTIPHPNPSAFPSTALHSHLSDLLSQERSMPPLDLLEPSPLTFFASFLSIGCCCLALAVLSFQLDHTWPSSFHLSQDVHPNSYDHFVFFTAILSRLGEEDVLRGGGHLSPVPLFRTACYSPSTRPLPHYPSPSLLSV
ncbi:hypothetical protein EVG20_g5044 [Dentipellis fragilis]|uniref:Uncharacterized protein n=1 Tax=Dentipellis fragilis TaxID=205917 RepID=A0A4Y9YUG8_9AGAM|nr:hypothetical protein EVG20_g5044 [Dentipellis fragilis]